MRYKIAIVCIFSMLMICSAFGSAVDINLKTINENSNVAGTSEVNINSPELGESLLGDPVAYFDDPELGYVFLQIACNIIPLPGETKRDLLIAANLALYITRCNQLFLDVCSRNIPEDSKAKYTMKSWFWGELYEYWLNDTSGGLDIFFPLPANQYIKIFTEITITVYDSNDNEIASDELPNNVFYVYIPTS